ncbi:MAG: adenosylcobinamide-GDP ribazoletransferase [Rhodocyclales bacterium]|nr:adenosylcobinamide-GDP ribazoletransferase [Rhodocyclales bacterium]
MIRTLFWRFVAALQFFTRLPLPRDLPQVPAHQAGAIGFFPWAGIVVGLLCGAVLLLGRWLWPTEVAAVLAVATAVALTGALHEDGLSDTVDGFGAGWDRMHILAIMKDVRLGNYGATALVLALAARIALTAALASRFEGGALLAAIVAAHAVSRGAVLLPMLALPYARAEDATSRAKPVVQSLDGTARLTAALGALAPLALLPPPVALAGLAAAGAIGAAWTRLCARRLGGYTGDVLGAVQQTGEIAFLLGILAAWKFI